MKKIFYFLLLFLSLVVGLVYFVGPFFNVAFFDEQCRVGGCRGEMCSTSSYGSRFKTLCVDTFSDRCNINCKSRNFQCNFDPSFQQRCLSCIQECKEQFGILSDSSFPTGSFEECLNTCS